jgi:toxin FitB
VSGFLLDTNVVSELRKGRRANPNVLAWFPASDEEQLFLSALVLGEIRIGIERIRHRHDAVQARALDRWLKGLEAAYVERILPVNTAVADRWGRLSATDPPSVIDGLMAATALENGLTLVTRDVQDISRTGVKVLNPFQGSA